MISNAQNYRDAQTKEAANKTVDRTSGNASGQVNMQHCTHKKKKKGVQLQKQYKSWVDDGNKSENSIIIDCMYESPMVQFAEVHCRRERHD